MCGDLTYDVDIDINVNIDITYTQTTHTIVIFCDDPSMIGVEINYTINVYLSLYAECYCTGCCSNSGGTIIITDPCNNPTIQVGVVLHVDFDFTTPTIFTVPQIYTTPSSCISLAVFTCEYVFGPYSGPIDLCSYVGSHGIYSTTITFSSTSGTWVFSSDDTVTFPPGVYHFEITVTIGISVQVIDFTMTIISHCDVPVLTLVSQPTTPHYYIISEPVLNIWTYNIATVVSSSLTTNCGVPMLIFSDIDGFSLAAIFNDDRSIAGHYSLSVYTQNALAAGEYHLHYTFYYSGMPSTNVVSGTFVIIVVNVCDPPPNCIDIPGCGIPPITVDPPTIDISIEVTVTVETSFTLPPWVCGTPGCGTQVIPICIDCNLGGGGIVVIVDNTITIHVTDCTDICSDDNNSVTVIIVIQGCLGVVCSEIDVPVIIYNPCVDIDFFGLMPVTIPDHHCELYDIHCNWMHNDFSIVASNQAIMDMCNIVYTINVDIDIEIYITYDAVNHIVVFYCEDTTLIDLTFSYTITVNVVGVEGQCGVCVGCCVSTTGIIIVDSPCLYPTISIGIVINISFDFGGPISWTAPPVTVLPVVCTDLIVYTCTYLYGPYTGPLDLCNLIYDNNGLISDIVFDVTTGVWVFDTQDGSIFVPGTYTFQITVTIGYTVTTTQFTLTVISHCEPPTLTIVDLPPTGDVYYILGEAPHLVWEYDLNTVVHSTVNDHCGGPVLNWQTTSGMQLSIIFTVDSYGQGSYSLTVYTTSELYAGEYEIQFVFYYSGQPSVSVTSGAFTVIVVNPCYPPPGCEDIDGCGIPDPTVIAPTQIIVIDVTVTVGVSFNLPAWTCGTAGCNTQITPECVNCGISGGTIIIVNNHLEINVNTCGTNMCDDPNGTPVVIVVQGCLGPTICAPINITIVVHNPCLDPGMISIILGLVPDYQYALLEDGCWQHNPFIVSATSAVQQICGNLVYMLDAGQYSSMLTYDASSYQICMYADDMSLINVQFTYTINVYFSNYPSCAHCSNSGSGMIIVHTPCDHPMIVTGVTQNVAFDFTGPRTWMPPAMIVNPATCG
jgi:hypothetical protein